MSNSIVASNAVDLILLSNTISEIERLQEGKEDNIFLTNSILEKLIGIVTIPDEDKFKSLMESNIFKDSYEKFAFITAIEEETHINEGTCLYENIFFKTDDKVNFKEELKKEELENKKATASLLGTIQNLIK